MDFAGEIQIFACMCCREQEGVMHTHYTYTSKYELEDSMGTSNETLTIARVVAIRGCQFTTVNLGKIKEHLKTVFQSMGRPYVFILTFLYADELKNRGE